MKQSKVVALSEVEETTTSDEVFLNGANILQVEVVITGTGTWKIDVQGALTKGGTVKDLFDSFGNKLTTENITTSRIQTFYVVADYVKIKATEVDGTATCTVNVVPVF